MRRWMMIVVMAVAVNMVARATEVPAVVDAVERHAAADKLLTLFNMDNTYDHAMKQAMSMATEMVNAQDIPEAEKDRARKAVEASITVSMEKFSWTRMKSIFLDIYADILSLEELDGLIAFYESPIGQKFLKKQPQLSLATMEKMQLLMQEMMPDLQKAVDHALELEAYMGEPASPAEETDE
ncbi:MAG: DUF2059 domain-containing protein [Lentisphaerae bacterium]|nr:DUF2059 domain-containing protein [Lentisphaerota bacterium]